MHAALFEVLVLKLHQAYNCSIALWFPTTINTLFQGLYKHLKWSVLDLDHQWAHFLQAQSICTSTVKIKKSCHTIESQGVILKNAIILWQSFYYWGLFFHGDFLKGLCSLRETNVINTGTCPKQQILFSAQKYQSNSILQELYSVFPILAVQEHNCPCFVKSCLSCIYKLGVFPQDILLVPVSVRRQIFMTWEKSSPCLPAQHEPLEYKTLWWL